MSGDAATISIDCPGCGKRFSVAAQHAGRKGKCKSCGTGMVIPAPQAQEEDVYDIAGDDSSPPAQIAVAAETPAPVVPLPAGPVLSYSSPVPRRVQAAKKPGEFDPFDHFEGNRFKNLYFPLILIVGTAAFNVIAEAFLKGNATSGIALASGRMVGKLLIEIPCMLIACLLAVKVLDAAFGPLGPAILKLSAIALAPDAIMDSLILIAFLFGRASGSPINMLVDVGIAAILGWILSLAFYFWLFMYFFELEFGDTWKLAIFIWFIRMVLTWLVSAFVLSFLSSHGIAI
jgi:hypothetical protein